jgi:hypothetical protein
MGLKAVILMNYIFLILICMFIVILCCVICGITGFLVGFSINYHPKEKTPAIEPTEQQKRDIKRRQREYNNFLNYDGTEQDKL